MLIFFIIYETLFQNTVKTLPIIYQNKTKLPGKKNMKCLVHLQKLEIISTICKLFEYNFWWNGLDLSNKMGLVIRIKIFTK